MYTKFLTGSHVFFEKIEGFTPKDTDWILFFNSEEEMNNIKILMYQGNDYFKYLKNNFVETLYNDIKNGKREPMCICAVLSPQICKFLNISLNDIECMQEFIPLLDNKHKYLNVIYNAYKQNNKMELTDTQLNKAYKLYIKYRQ